MAFAAATMAAASPADATPAAVDPAATAVPAVAPAAAPAPLAAANKTYSKRTPLRRANQPGSGAILLLIPFSDDLMSENLPNLTALNEIIGDDKSFVLRIVQPGLAGLMDGSVSTLAPIFATAFATHNSRTVFLIGAASAVGAGISMAFSEGLSDDGELTGRGNPVFRGLVTGLMTFIGGFLHTLPFLIPNVHTALTWAYAVVGVELVVIALIRHRYFKTSFALSCLQVIVGGGLVFAAGVLIGQS
jgi:VIT1/CCC1 family predicted Fe2+/Mn2+ transporter